MENLFCPVHKEVKADIDKIELVQIARPCIAHDVQISALEKSDDDQWVEINKLKRLVYLGAGGVGAAAFLGSILGSLTISYFKR